MASDEENEKNELDYERKAKQNYLSEEVLEVGYNPQLFMEYISSIKECDIDSWTLEELEQVVRDFKAKYRPEDSPKEEPVKPVVVKPVQPNPATQSPNPEPQAKKEITPVLAEEIKSETNSLKSKVSEKNQLTECPNLVVKVSEPSVTGGGIFSGKYVVYTVTTDPFGWIVKRRYSDFLNLREILSAAYISTYLPPIPSKKAKGNLEDKTMFERQEFLNQFLVVLIKDNLLRGSPHLLNFLKEPDEGKNSKYLKSIKNKKIEKIDQTININGQALVEYGDFGKLYDSQMNYINITENLKQKVKQKCTQLMDDNRRLSDALKKYAELIKELQEAQNKIPNNESQGNICKFLHESFTAWSDYENKNIEIVNEDMKLPFAYSYKEGLVLKELLKERESLYANYRKLEAKQKPDKSRESLDRAKEFFGYSNYKTQREVERVLNDETQLSKAHFLKAAKRQVERTQEFSAIWEGLLSKLSEMKFN